MFRLARTPTRSKCRPSARTYIMFFRVSREMFAFLSVYIIRVSAVQTCEDPQQDGKKDLEQDPPLCSSGPPEKCVLTLCMYKKSL